jgi:hypothetical protein
MEPPIDSGRRKDIHLSARGISRAASLENNNLFAFVVGGREYYCKRFQASFVSARICEMLASDPTIDHFVVEGLRQEDVCDAFEDVISLLNGQTITLRETNVEFLRFICKCLVNEELEEMILEYEFGSEGLKLGNAVSRLLKKFEFGLSIDEEVHFIATHFYEYEAHQLQPLGFDHLENVISQDSLRLLNEDSLLEFISDLGRDFFDLMRYIECQYLSAKSMDGFLEMVSYRSIDSIVWSSLCRRLRRDLADSSGMPDRFVKSSQFPFAEDSPLSGIMAHLAAECQGNVQAKGIVDIEASSTGYGQLWQVADQGNSYWRSENEANSWIRFDFKDKRILSTDYSVQSAGL